MLLPQETRASGSNIEKESQMPHLKLNIYIYIYIYIHIYILYIYSFLETRINFVEQRLKFSHSE